MEGNLWSETIRTSGQLEEMLFPRMLALAERAWHKAAWESESDIARQRALIHSEWTLFANTLGYKELRRLEDLGFSYYLPVPGAM